MMNRLYYYDNAKFLLIISVIMGHLLQNNGLHDSVSIGLFDTIFMYSMPLFVFISGLFSQSINSKKYSGTKFLISLLSLFEPLVIFSFILALPSVLSAGISRSLFIPGYTLWYLLALIWYRLIFHYLPSPILHYKYALVIILFIISIVSGGYYRFEALSIPRALFFLPYFGLGYCLADKRDLLVRYVNRIPRILPIVILLSVFTLNTYFSYNQLPYNTGNVPYEEWNMSLPVAIIWRIMFSMICIVVSFCFLCLVPNTKLKMSEFGKNTLVIYVYHSVMLTIVKFACEYMGGAQNIFVAFIEFFIVVPLLIFISKNKLASFIIAPISNTFKRKHYKSE